MVKLYAGHVLSLVNKINNLIYSPALSGAFFCLMNERNNYLIIDPIHTSKNFSLQCGDKHSIALKGMLCAYTSPGCNKITGT
jgi:hypothetical protein